MDPKKLIAVCGACAAAGVVAAPAAGAQTQSPDLVDFQTTNAPLGAPTVRAVEQRAATHVRLGRAVVRLARAKERLQGDRLGQRRARELRHHSLDRLVRKHRELRQDVSELRAAARERAAARARAAAAAAATRAATATPTTAAASSGGGGASVAGGTLSAIAACESGGNPSAVDSSGTYRGKYQFDYGTWASVGGAGDPAAASEAEQDRRAAMLYAQRGSAPWPVCGR